MAVALPWIALAVGVAVTMMGSQGAAKAGEAEARRGGRLKALGEFEARQLEQNALTEVAAAQRAGMEEERKAELAASRALALAAASGGGASDPTVSKIISDLAGEGSYRRAVELYEGEDRARQMRLGAVARRREGEAGLQGGLASQRAYTISGQANALTGIGRIGTSLYQKYGGTGPTQMTTTSSVGTGSEGSFIDAGTPGLAPYA